MPLTREQKKKYIANGGTECPYCGENVEDCGGLDFLDEFLYQKMHCTGCGKHFTNQYKLIGVGEPE